MDDLILWHLADSALPVGSFAYSGGLEALLEFGLVHSPTELEKYILNLVHQALHFDLPYIHAVYHAYPLSSLTEILHNFEATFTTRSMYEGSVNLGKNWLRLLEAVLMKEEISQEIRKLLATAEIPTHILIVYSLAFKMLHIPAEKLITFHLSNLVRDQMSAAIRLGVVGPMLGHQMHHRLLHTIGPKIKVSAMPDYKNAYKSALVTDVVQMLHKNVYSKLFKN